MKPLRLIDRTTSPDGQELALYQREETWVIKIGGDDLMSSRMHGSEEDLARLAVEARGGRPIRKVVVGGLGMGYTLRAVLAALDDAGLGRGVEVVVAELFPEVVRWNRGPLGPLAGHPLRDPRVRIALGDAVDLLIGPAEAVSGSQPNPRLGTRGSAASAMRARPARPAARAGSTTKAAEVGAKGASAPAGASGGDEAAGGDGTGTPGATAGRAEAADLDLVMLDLDNGPDAFTVAHNGRLYERPGLERLRARLSPGGVLAVWSAHDDPAFVARLQTAGYVARARRVGARPGGRGGKHVIFLAVRDGAGGAEARGVR